MRVGSYFYYTQPSGVLVLSREASTTEIAVEDQITHLQHGRLTSGQVSRVIEDYSESGALGFQLQDDQVALARNVVGRVVYQSTVLGAVALWIDGHIWLLFIICIGLLVLSLTLRGVDLQLTGIIQALKGERKMPKFMLSKQGKRD